MKVNEICFPADITPTAGYTFRRNMKDAHFSASHHLSAPGSPRVSPRVLTSEWTFSVTQSCSCVAGLLGLSQASPHITGRFLDYWNVTLLRNQEVKSCTAALLKPSGGPGCRDLLWFIKGNNKTFSSWSFVTSSRLPLVINEFLKYLVHHKLSPQFMCQNSCWWFLLPLAFPMLFLWSQWL